jgi:copper chaperone CopZ
MYQKLSKSQKQIARRLIDKAIEIECGHCIKKIKSLLEKDEIDEKSNHKKYLDLCKIITKVDQNLAEKYDDMEEDDYLITVYGLYVENILTVKDLNEFDDDIRNELIKLKKLRKRGVKNIFV